MKKHCVAKVLRVISEIFLREDKRNNNFCRFSYEFALAPFLSFLRKQKQASTFLQVSGVLRFYGQLETL